MESRCGESSYDYRPYAVKSNNVSSESRVSSGESRTVLTSKKSAIVSSESRNGWGESRVADYTSSKPAPKTPIKYNNLREIDDLINMLEASVSDIEKQNPSAELNTLINETKDKIEILKQLSEEARRKEKEQHLVEMLKGQNEKLDAAIMSLKRGFK